MPLLSQLLSHPATFPFFLHHPCLTLGRFHPVQWGFCWCCCLCCRRQHCKRFNTSHAHHQNTNMHSMIPSLIQIVNNCNAQNRYYGKDSCGKQHIRSKNIQRFEMNFQDHSHAITIKKYQPIINKFGQLLINNTLTSGKEPDFPVERQWCRNDIDWDIKLCAPL